MDMGNRTGGFYLGEHDTTNFRITSKTFMDLVFLDICKYSGVHDPGKVPNEGYRNLPLSKIIMSSK